MKVYNLQLGELRSNCYVIETAPGRCVAVDIGGDSRLLVEFLRMKKLSLRKILLTHGHFDHIGGAEEVHKATGAEVYIHSDDVPMLTSESLSLASSISIRRLCPSRTGPLFTATAISMTATALFAFCTLPVTQREASAMFARTRCFRAIRCFAVRAEEQIFWAEVPMKCAGRSKYCTVLTAITRYIRVTMKHQLSTMSAEQIHT